ncbi:MAG TPA: hypothetical protein DCP11_04465 [Microbacteriaceae bacterium]|nr:hypothetical protein [Microbacteriaceae bacterium]
MTGSVAGAAHILFPAARGIKSPRQALNLQGDSCAATRAIAPRAKKEVPVGRLNEEVEDATGTVVKYRRHANGRGLVSPRARVEPSAFVSSTAYVEAEARVGDGSSIGAGSWIDQGVIIGERVFVGQNVHVGRDSQVGSGARLGSHSRIGSNVLIASGVRIEPDAVVSDDAVIHAPQRAQRAPSRRHASGGRQSHYSADEAA